MAITPSSPFLSLDHQFLNHHHHHHHHSLLFTPKHHIHPFLNSPKPNLITPLPLLSSSHSSSSFSLTSPLPSPSSVLENEQDPFQIGRFLTNSELEKLNSLRNYGYNHELESGSLFIRVMRPDELDATVALLSESFAESMLLPKAYVRVLGFLVKQYLIERRGVMPHAATLLGYFKEGEEDELKLAGTVEVCFNQRGANGSPTSPTAPRTMPYISNMTVKRTFRRRGIGSHLLKSSEELISQMSSSKEVYLHCRMIDAVPFNMYTRAGYSVYKTDSILTLLKFQRRKHLMRKYLQALDTFSETGMPKEELSS